MANAAPLMTYSELARDVGGELISFLPPGDPGFLGVSIDSRSVQGEDLFVALKGTAADGHRFVDAAFRAGATGALVETAALRDANLGIVQSAHRAGGCIIAVEHSLQALQDAARSYLARFPALLRIAITGSSGKTGTKELAAAMIQSEKRVIMNQGNLNSETGLPLSVFLVRPFHEVGIFEMGMNQKGEIEALARIVKPHFALITNIGTAHIGNIGSQLEILYEKKQIFSQFTGNETAFIPQNDRFRDLLAEDIRGNTIFFGPECLEELGDITERGLAGFDILWEGVSAHFKLPGRHNVSNVLAAAALAKAVPVGPEAIRTGIEAVEPLFGRSEVLHGVLCGETASGLAQGGEITVLRDCYNANPEAMEKAVEFCDSLDWPGRRIYVIGSMLELGALSDSTHAALGDMLAESRADRVFLFGSEAKAAMGQNRKIPFVHTDIMSDLSQLLKETLLPGDLVLLKGSRGCALEQVLDGLFIRIDTE